MIGLIGGSGLYEIPGFRFIETVKVETPFGAPSDEYTIGEVSGIRTVFLPRHSRRHDTPPHLVNYRANIWGFKQLGVERIITVNAVGGISPYLKPGQIVLPDQIIDFTQSRKNTFYEGPEVVHVDFTEPFCPEMREVMIRTVTEIKLSISSAGTYVCTEGPRLETKAEIKMFRALGGDIVGMTGMPEAVLAREAELCFMMIAVVTNYAAGISGKPLTTKEVIQTMNDTTDTIKNILSRYIPLLPHSRGCTCKDALKEARI